MRHGVYSSNMGDIVECIWYCKSMLRYKNANIKTLLHDDDLIISKMWMDFFQTPDTLQHALISMQLFESSNDT